MEPRLGLPVVWPAYVEPFAMPAAALTRHQVMYAGVVAIQTNQLAPKLTTEAQSSRAPGMIDKCLDAAFFSAIELTIRPRLFFTASRWLWAPILTYQ
jgi:hypothetical protein